MITKVHKGTDIHVVWSLQLNNEDVDYSIVKPELSIKGPRSYKKITDWTGSLGKIEFDYNSSDQKEIGIYEVEAVFFKGIEGQQYTVDHKVFQLVVDSDEATDSTLSSVSVSTLDIGDSEDLTKNSLYLLWLQEGHTGTVTDFFSYMSGNPVEITINGKTAKSEDGKIDFGTIETEIPQLSVKINGETVDFQDNQVDLGTIIREVPKLTITMNGESKEFTDNNLDLGTVVKEIPEMSVVLNGTENKFTNGKVYLNIEEHPSTEIDLCGKTYTSDESGKITIPEEDLPWNGWAEYK